MTKCEQQREKNWTNEFVSASGTYVTVTNNLAFKSSKSHKEKRKKTIKAFKEIIAKTPQIWKEIEIYRSKQLSEFQTR